MEKLKPCPFCGGDAEIAKHHRSFSNDSNGYYWNIYCLKCTAIIGTYLSKEDAIEAWNRRADDEKKQ